MTAYKTRNIAVLIAVAALATVITVHHDALAQTLNFLGNNNRYGYHAPNLAPIRLLLIGLSGLIGFAIGWFLSPQAAAFRRIFLLGFATVLGLVILLDNGLWGWGLTPFASFAAFMAGLGYWAQSAVERFFTPPKIFGDSQWASNEELEDAGLFQPKGIRLGSRLHFETDTAIYYGGDRHMFTCAPNRSGKGTTAIITNLLTYQGSVVVIDPKGENAMITADRRKEMGQEVHIVDPWEETGMEISCCNPMDVLVAGDVDMADEAMILATAMIIPNEKDPFWTDKGTSIIHGVIGQVASDPDEADNRHLGRVRDLLLLDGEGLKALFTNMLGSPYHFVRSAGAQGLQMDEKLLSNVLATLQSQTNFLDSPRIRESLSKSDFDFADLKTRPMTINLVLPSDKLDSHGRFLRLLLQQALSVNARKIEQQPEHPVLFILDELPALGPLPMVEKAFGLMAGYGIKLWAIAQNLSQLKRIYGDGFETFIANAGVIQYFGSRDKMTAEYFSTLCGVNTVWSLSSAIGRTVGKSHSSGANGGSISSSVSDSETVTYSTVQQQLAYPDQLMRMDKGKQLLFVENMNPIIANKRPWFEDEELKHKGVNLYANEPRQSAEDA